MCVSTFVLNSAGVVMTPLDQSDSRLKHGEGRFCLNCWSCMPVVGTSFG